MLLNCYRDVNDDVRFEFYYKCGNQSLVFHKLIALEDVGNKSLKGIKIWERRKDLSYCTLKVGYFQEPPFVSKEDEKTNLEHYRRVFDLGGKIMYGREVQMFKLLHSIMNFSVLWEYVTDEKFGSHRGDYTIDSAKCVANRFATFPSSLDDRTTNYRMCAVCRPKMQN